jgi:hypothetical protein
MLLVQATHNEQTGRESTCGSPPAWIFSARSVGTSTEIALKPSMTTLRLVNDFSLFRGVSVPSLF